MRDLMMIVEATGSLPASYIEALTRLGRVFRRSAGVVVGGAAVTFYTGGAILSGDFDFVVHADDQKFAAAMQAEGFVAENRSGKLRIGWYHPDLPNYGFQSVSGPLFDGLADASKLRTCRFGGNAVTFAAPEDLIADRLAQHSIASPTDPSRLIQARLMYRVVPNLDEDYMLRRIKQDGGDPALLETKP